MIKFRKHRGALAESMKTVKEYETIEKMKESVLKECGLFPNDVKVTIEPYDGDDDRIGWKNVHIVMIDNYVVGFMTELAVDIESRRFMKRSVEK